METKVVSFLSNTQEWANRDKRFHLELDIENGELVSGRLFNDKGSLITESESFYHVVNNAAYGDKIDLGDDFELVENRSLVGFRQKSTGLMFGIKTVYDSWSDMEYGEEFYIMQVSEPRREQNPFDSYQTIEVRDVSNEEEIIYKYGT
ncbi:hypothetical protein phiOC_p182 [Ochrobactrum phage vB_OspM_OC]|nr:hypothetical protein phiOC_p182 [Ochrobactrum phage vB_OspM_OC]